MEEYNLEKPLYHEYIVLKIENGNFVLYDASIRTMNKNTIYFNEKTERFEKFGCDKYFDSSWSHWSNSMIEFNINHNDIYNVEDWCKRYYNARRHKVSLNNRAQKELDEYLIKQDK